ncbi:substrate-binding domain-containing protein [Mucilaginibacter sabulilitoris]|uniref:Substrate-binding domain-containing protein n=1 Tax=Mucilaginibacter sabulilitoris TaxID=1173583 RepID=A0ABZ0TPZ1_9SPHI|nr:substrate-binding domain-containing protein [Mucilaginibacter sabulilitoris]WPU93799.1 substrate-binding domain-containing protein [Mucilaginibacter sabulilitoris]
MTNSLKIALAAITAVVFQSCQNKTKTPSDTFVTGSVSLVADESFKPIISEEEYVFKSLFPEAKPNIIYKSENDALRLLLNDSVRVAILARSLDTGEIGVLKRRTLPPVIRAFAIDAVALIVNQASNDTLITVSDIKKMLNGNAKTDKNIVFDNPNSSLVRYLKDLSGNKELKQKNIYALKSNIEVLKYVNEHPNAIGIVGFNWLSDPDKDYADAVSKVKVIAVKDEDNRKFKDEYFKPSQSSLVLKQYPLSRELYIINSTGKMGLGTGFSEFVLSERGQRIILKSNLTPEAVPGREINIKH